MLKMVSSTSFCILLLSTLPVAYTFDRDKCYQQAQWLLGNNTISSQSDLFFRDDFSSPAYSGADNMTLTFKGCNAICGPKQTWYTDVGPRLTIWLIPILLLLANVELSPLDKRNYCAILHLLGDPIDSIWSLLHKLDSWDWCCRGAARLQGLCSSCQRVIGTVLAGFEEVQGPRIKSDTYFDAVLKQRSLHMSFSEWRRTALQLADARTDELGRIVFAFMLYILQPVGAFVPEVGGVPPGPPGGRIATGVLLSWLVPAILLSNLVGNLSSRRTAHDFLAEFARRTSEEGFEHLESHSVFLPSFPSLARARTSTYFDSLGWAGGIYTYRPWKARSTRTSQHPHLRNLLALDTGHLHRLLRRPRWVSDTLVPTTLRIELSSRLAHFSGGSLACFGIRYVGFV